MTHQEIKELAGHRAVSPWIMKLVGDAIAIEREICAKICEDFADQDSGPDGIQIDYHAYLIRQRGEK